MAGRRMKVEPMEDTTGSEAPAGTPAPTADIVQSPNGRRGDLTQRVPGASSAQVEHTVSDFVTKLGNEQPTNGDEALALLIRDQPDPERDLVQCGYRLPRYVKEAFRLTALRLDIPEQDVVYRLVLMHPGTRQTYEQMERITLAKARSGR